MNIINISDGLNSGSTKTAHICLTGTKESLLTCPVRSCSSVCPACQAAVPALWVQLPCGQMTRLGIIDLSKSIVSASISWPHSVGCHLCVCACACVCVCVYGVCVCVCLRISCPKSSREPISAHQVAAIWVLPLNTQQASCVGSVLNAWKHKFAW